MDQLEKELNGIEFDREVAGDFLADAQAAMLLDSRQLLLSLFAWLRRYHTARGMRGEDVTRLIHALADELRLSTPSRLAQEIFIVAAESEGQQLPVGRTPKGGREILQFYLRLLLDHEGAEARNLILEKVAEGKTIHYLYAHILEPAMIEIGRLWSEGEISVADEHYATVITESLVNTLHPLRKTHVRKGRVLLATVQSELHALGIRIVGDLLELDGWDTIYFGPNLPLESICSAIEKERPDLIALSVTTPSNLLRTAEAIERIRAVPEASSTPVIVGGYPFLLDHSLWRVVGADAWAASGVHAVRVARALFARNRAMAAGVPEAPGVSAETARFRLYRPHTPTHNEELVRLMSELSAVHTRLRNRNAVIEELNEEKNRFLGMAAHDLRNEISTATLLSRLLGQSKGLSEFQRKLVDRMDAVLESMLDLVDGYLDISRIEAGRLDLHPESIDLISLVDDRISMARLLADQVAVRISRSGIPGPATVNVDPKRISQALNNLLLNAVQFSPSGGKVDLVVREEGESYTIEIMDEGPGIPSEQARRLFGPFTTLETAEKRRSGTGLGLHIARRVIEAHGGSIGFRPGTPQGSVFSITLPKLAPLDSG